MAAASGVAVLATADDAPAKKAAPVGAKAPTDPNTRLEVLSVGQDPAAVKKYWTPARIKAAKPLTTKNVNAAPAAAQQLSAMAAEQHASGAPTLPEDSPEALSAQSAGYSAQAVKTARQWTRHGKPPARTVGKLFGVDSRNRQYTCSAAVISSKNKRTVWTAAHCLHSGRGGRAGFSKHVMFRPDYKDGKSYGSWVADRLVALEGWTKKGDLRYDIAGFTVKPYRGKGIQYYTGSQGYNFGYKKRAYPMYSFGYPARALPSKKAMNSNRLWYCSGKTFGVNYGSGSVGLGMWCSMGNGASGGPWIYGMQRNGLGRIVGVNSTHSLRTLQMNSPYHGTAAVNVYRAIAR
ncbi:trypsin-like serine peptidase [Spirillospora sp. NPDC127200]